MKKNISFVIFIAILVLSLTGCTAKTDPANVVVNYLNALVNQDSDSAVAVSCSDWEEQAKLETDSFLSVEAVLNNVKCNTLTSDDSTAEVSCTGTIDMTYNEEIRSIDLSLRIYALQFQAGEWLVCGYK
ncbi:MAG: hypothetical protein AB2L18_00030 [Anaerolineaceae bacterium]